MSDTAVRPGRVLRTLLVALAVVGAGTVALGAIAYCSVLGCTFLAEDFEPHGEEATRDREAASAAVLDLAGRVTTDGRVIATSSSDTCRTGQNDWKRQDTYSHECTVEQSRVIVLVPESAGRDAVADGLTRADAVLRRAGCEPTPRGGLDRVRDDYWVAANPNVLREGAAGLPEAGYTCGGDLRVGIEPTSSRASALSLDTLTGPDPWADDVLSADWYTGEDARALREAEAGLALVVTVGETYYRTRF